MAKPKKPVTPRKAEPTKTARPQKLRIDRLLLDIATKQYRRVAQELAKRRRQVDEQTKTAQQIGERILKKAKAVSNSLVNK